MGERFRRSIGFLADLWDAAKIAAISLDLIVAAIVATAIFVLDIMPPGLLAVLVVGIVGVSAVVLHGVARELLPTPPAVRTRCRPS